MLTIRSSLDQSKMYLVAGWTKTKSAGRATKNWVVDRSSASIQKVQHAWNQSHVWDQTCKPLVGKFFNIKHIRTSDVEIVVGGLGVGAFIGWRVYKKFGVGALPLASLPIYAIIIGAFVWAYLRVEKRCNEDAAKILDDARIILSKTSKKNRDKNIEDARNTLKPLEEAEFAYLKPQLEKIKTELTNFDDNLRKSQHKELKATILETLTLLKSEANGEDLKLITDLEPLCQALNTPQEAFSSIYSKALGLEKSLTGSQGYQLLVKNLLEQLNHLQKVRREVDLTASLRNKTTDSFKSIEKELAPHREPSVLPDYDSGPDTPRAINPAGSGQQGSGLRRGFLLEPVKKAAPKDAPNSLLVVEDKGTVPPSSAPEKKD